MDKVRNTSIREKTKLTDVTTYSKQLKWDYAGRLARTTGKWSHDILDWKPEGKRGRGRPRTRWEDEIIKMAGEEWKTMAQDKITWRHLGETFIQQWIDNASQENSNLNLMNVCDST